MSKPALRFLEVTGDRMQPLLNRGDYVLVAAASCWLGEELYVLRDCHGTEVIHMVSANGTRDLPIRLSCCNRLYPANDPITKAAFSKAVVAKVVMTCNVQDHSLISQFRLAA